jgi:hypothetical protein
LGPGIVRPRQAGNKSPAGRPWSHADRIASKQGSHADSKTI